MLPLPFGAVAASFCAPYRALIVKVRISPTTIAKTFGPAAMTDLSQRFSTRGLSDPSEGRMRGRSGAECESPTAVSTVVL